MGWIGWILPSEREPMSGYVQGEVSWPGIPGAATGFVQKPFALDELKEKVSELVDLPTPGLVELRVGAVPDMEVAR